MYGFPSLLGIRNETFLEKIVAVWFKSILGNGRRLLTTELIHNCELVVVFSPRQLKIGRGYDVIMTYC